MHNCFQKPEIHECWKTHQIEDSRVKKLKLRQQTEVGKHDKERTILWKKKGIGEKEGEMLGQWNTLWLVEKYSSCMALRSSYISALTHWLLLASVKEYTGNLSRHRNPTMVCAIKPQK